jgi:ribulose-5-phosphate 4-epimerase/fuculose-1-phosphate aldolase
MTMAEGKATSVAGGAAEWSPKILPPVPELDPRQKLACAFRILSGIGFTENIAGHITVQASDGGNLLVNPWGLWWDEIKASDLSEVDMDARVIAGKWDVTPAIHIHTELHRRRGSAARVVIHNHPYHVTVLAALGLVPEMIHQTTAMFDGDLAFVDEYTGEVATADLGAELAERVGDRNVVILANHGVIVTGTTVEEATYRAATIDRQCRLMYDVATSGRAYSHLPQSFLTPMRKSLIERGPDFFWGGAVRQLIRREPEVLE